MNLIKFILFFTFLWLMRTMSFAQQESFPQSWVGTWKGTMELHYKSGKSQEIVCELHLKEADSTNTWQWTIIYGEGATRQERKYRLIAQNMEKGMYRIDENNSIILDAFYANHTLISQFVVQDNLITSTYQRVGNVIYFQNLASNQKKYNQSGGKDKIPEVLSFPISSLQRAKLLKVD